MLIYGKQSIYYLIDHHPQKIEKLYLAKDVDKKEYSALMKHDFEVKRIPQNAAQQMSKSGNHQGYLADVEDIVLKEVASLKKRNFVLILSSITDVGNIGAIIRSAYALGVDAVVISGLKKIAFESIARSSSGALFDMPILFCTNVHDIMNDLKTMNYEIYGADIEGENIKDAVISSKRVLILGSEGEGLPSRVLKKLDHKVKIEMAHGFDSLNVSAAGAILMDRMR
ncbi:MAG: 23S rRNA (guanosine(2251)-2'-O)-methyltransferase RlmB [Campylobacterota bacterium]|nr:23S rRNA (guanosine(2251)-2'-O)-methyltransferase RlmB [Campylobacterota bacterium]